MKLQILSLITFLSICQVFGQTEDVKYRRSSLSMNLIESASYPNKDTVMSAWRGYEFPDKYNNHSIDIGNMEVDNVESIKDEDMPAEIEKFITETDLAKKIVAKWFNYTPNNNASSPFNMQLVQDRGFYNATEMDAAVASGQTRGFASLGDAGEELIGKTFITFSKLRFEANEVYARGIRDAALSSAELINSSLLRSAAEAAANKAYAKAKEGYSVTTKTWLYQLDWNEETANAFYAMWNDPEAFENSDIFKLKYIGKEASRTLVTASLKKGEGQRSDEEMIRLATVRNVDRVFANLQKEYDAFKPVTPILSSNPITAKIGLKEGLEPGDKFEILEMNWDKKSQTTIWKKVGTCSVSKKAPILDNRYYATDKPDVILDEKGKEIEQVSVTTFKGPKNAQSGMLLKQIK